MPGSSGRPSTSSSLVGFSSSPQGIGYSPSTPPASSSIPSFRSLRSFLPFGSNKNAATTSASSLSTSPNNRSPFGAFGSVRRSMTKDRERKTSLSNDAMEPPVMAIEKSNSDSFPDDTTIIRESLSFSKTDKPLPSEPSPSPSSCEDKSTASPDLSTIIEADTSGASKQITANSSPAANRNAKSTQGRNNTHGDAIHECDEDASAMDLSTTHLAEQVRDAIREGDSLKDRWLNADKAAIIDGDEDPSVADAASNIVPVDHDLGDLPSPRSAIKQLPMQTSSTPNKASPNPTTPTFLASPTSRLPLARQASSFLPLFRSSNSSSPSPQLPIHLTPPSLATPKPSSSIVVNGNSYNNLKSSSSPLPSTSTPLRDWDGRRTPSLRAADTTTTAVRDRTSSISRIPAKMRKRSMTLQEKFGRGRNEDVVRSGSSLSIHGTKTSLGSGGGVESGSSVNESGASSGPKMEWLGPRTAKAFRAAGLLDFDRETGSAVPRRGSGSFSGYGGTSLHGANSGGGAGSSYGHSGLMESPTLTVSSGSRERDTPKSSISTASTSLADSFGYLGRDRSERDLNREREHEREEMREMKEKHGIEMGALLGALSDSQRTVRVLREENSDLRDRLERLTVAVQANQELRQVCGDLQSECNSLRRENVDLRKELAELRGLTHSWRGGGSNSSGLRSSTPKATSSNSPLARIFTSEVVHEEYDDTFIDHGSQVENHHQPHYDSSDIILPPSSPVSSKKRRLSNSSSIFPIPPSNMTLLLHEDVTSTFGSVGDHHSQYGFPLPPSTQQQRKMHVQYRSSSQSNNDSPPPISYLNFVGNIPPPNSSGDGGISPSTANFSMVTGSPRSLLLRPEHEILLGDMESLDLGVRNGDS